jgi:DNA-binding transcriptional LysR family regulator
MSFDARMLSGIGVLAAVVDAGSFVHAGRALGLTQSGVSRAIAKLEERVGVRLFQRNSRAVALTEEGRRFYERVIPLITGLEEAASEAAGASEKPRGHLRVVVDPLVARIFIGPRVTRFLSENSSMSLDVTVRDRLGDMVAEGFDVAVRFGEPEPSSLITRKLLETRVLTCASPDYLKRRGRPKSPRELTNHECILFPEPPRTTHSPSRERASRGRNQGGCHVCDHGNHGARWRSGRGHSSGEGEQDSSHREELFQGKFLGRARGRGRGR